MYSFMFSDLSFFLCSLGCVVDDYPQIAAASMWTRKDIKDFKDSLRRDKDSVIKIGSGETVTVSMLLSTSFPMLADVGSSKSIL